MVSVTQKFFIVFIFNSGYVRTFVKIPHKFNYMYIFELLHDYSVGFISVVKPDAFCSEPNNALFTSTVGRWINLSLIRT